MDIAYDPLKNVPVEQKERRASFREISGATFNELQECCHIIGAISESLVGESDFGVSAMEVKCYRDGVTAINETAAYIRRKLDEIAETIGV